MSNNKRPLVGVGVMIVWDNKVLLGKRKNAHGEGTYGWAGGHLEFGESLEECATREVFEETGVKIKKSALKFLCLSNIIEYGKHYVDIEFLCSDFPGEPKTTEPEKRENWKWYNINRLPLYQKAPPCKGGDEWLSWGFRYGVSGYTLQEAPGFQPGEPSPKPLFKAVELAVKAYNEGKYYIT